MRISDWSSDVCSSDLGGGARGHRARVLTFGQYAFDIGIEENPLGLDVQRDFDAFRLLLAADVEPAAAHQRIDEQQREVEDDLHRRLRQRFGPDHPVEGDRAVADDALDRRFGFVGWYKLAEDRKSKRLNS